jgi:hypothetical protein
LASMQQFDVLMQQTATTAPEQLSFGDFAVEQVSKLDDFGDFDTCPQVAAMPTPTMPIDTVGSLCSLDSLSLNSPAAISPSPPRGPGGIASPNGAGKQAYAQHSAFTGLDGFSTAPRPMRPTGISPPAGMQPPGYGLPSTYCQTPMPYNLHTGQTPMTYCQTNTMGQPVSNGQQINPNLRGQPQSDFGHSNYPT